MKEKNKAPKRRGKVKRWSKSTVKNRILQLLLTGKYNVQELSTLTGSCDPRAHIRDLRDRGIEVSDYWVYTRDRRFKVYFIHQQEYIRKNGC